jgi:hypothetical protein
MLLRNTLLATTALTLVVVPALAADVTYPAAPPPPGSPLYSPASLVTGDLSLAIGAASGGGENLGAYEGTGRAALPLTGGFNFEAELLDDGFFQNGESVNSFSAVGHLYAQNQTDALGVYGGASSLFYASGWTGGVEGQIYLSKFTLDGSLGFASIQGGGSTGWGAKLGGRYYFDPNTKLSIYGNFSSADGENLWGVSGAVEHRFAASPWSLFVKASWNTVNGGPSDTEVLGGVRVSLDAPNSTLESHDMAVPWQTEPQTDFFNAFSVSDVRLKRDIVLIDHLPNGLGLYRYRYLWSDTVYVGVMAQEVAKAVPEAVVAGADGFLRVNYALLGTTLMTWDQWVAAKAGRVAPIAIAWPPRRLAPADMAA